MAWIAARSPPETSAHPDGSLVAITTRLYRTLRVARLMFSKSYMSGMAHLRYAGMSAPRLLCVGQTGLVLLALRFTGFDLVDGARSRHRGVP